MADAPQALTLPELEAALCAMVQARYGAAESDGEAEAMALQAQDCEYLATHIRCLGAGLAVAATHPGVSREMLAMAIKLFRRDAGSLSVPDVVGLLTSIITGSAQAFEAVLRTRKGSERKPAALPWGKDTD